MRAARVTTEASSEKRTGVRVRRGSLSALHGHGARVSFAECPLFCTQERSETDMSETSPFPQRVKSTLHVKMTKTVRLLETPFTSTPRSTWPLQGFKA